MSVIQVILLIPVVCGSVYALLCMWTVFQFRSATRAMAIAPFSEWPPVTILKPVCGLEKDLRTNLRSTCIQEYPAFQVVFSVQRPDDPAIPLLREIQQEFGCERVTVAIEAYDAGPNGKINNLIGGFKHARHEILVISDSDVQLRPDYLKTIVAPLADPQVGYVCTLYKAIGAETWFEKMELLTINAELTPNMAFALVTGAAQFCLGASTAVRRTTLQQIGGLESLADYLVEDFEMGQRIWSMGQKPVILPYLVDTVVDLKTPSQWWNHLVYWDQNNRAARPGALFSTLIIRPVPFACLFALSTLGSTLGLAILGAALSIRLVTATAVMGWGLKDADGLRSVALLPFRDLAALASWFLAFTKRTTIWRGEAFILTRDGKLVRQNTTACDNSLSQGTTSASPSR
ncbi:bacteriohopanetetrol glucosamine biosynthesis glycosyltransferase HpnI [Nitrospira sp. Nam74]